MKSKRQAVAVVAAETVGIVREQLARFRSAITGRYVSKWYAKTHPDTTVEETG